MILRIHTPEMGTIRLNGRDYADRKGLTPCSSARPVQPSFKTRMNRSHRAKRWTPTCTTPRCGKIAPNREAARQLIDDTLRDVGMSLAVVQGKYPTQFSGGE